MGQRFSFKYSLTTFVLVLVILFCTSAGLAQTTSFTYQGRLTDSGTAANGNYDLQFALFDSVSGGTQIGSTLTLNTVAVSNGIFTVSLDFGANAFPGANRFVEIRARAAGAASFTTLAPRQPITSTPYAVRSLKAASADTVPISGVPAGSGNYIQNSGSPQTANFNISGDGTASGTLSGGVVNATTQFNLNGIRILRTRTDNLFAGAGAGASDTTGNNNTFIGFNSGQNTTSPSSFGRNTFVGSLSGVSNTEGIDNSFFGFAAGSSNTQGFNNAFFGRSAGSSNTTGSNNTIVGENANVGSENLSNATAIGAFARVDQSNSLVLGSIDGVNGAFVNTRVGIGTTAPTARLSVVATGDGARVLHLGTERAWVFKQLGTGLATALELTGDDPNNNNKNFVINTQGSVGISTTGPLDRLHVFGDIRVGVTGTNGCLKNNNGGTIVGTCSSDLRFKRNLVSFSPVLQKLTRLQPRYFFWRAEEFPKKNFGVAREAGLVAQEVELVLPELVNEDAQGFKMVDYSKLPLMLLQAVKELKVENEKLKREQQAQIEKLQQVNAALNARLHKVERALQTKSRLVRRR